MADLGVVERGWLAVEDGRISGVGAGAAPSDLLRTMGEAVVEAGGRVVLPGFVDCHTHACWAGDRFDEADLRLAGVPYLEILARGGGIMSTVRATRAATVEVLAQTLAARVRTAERLGTTTIEVKTGYGLEPQAELRMLDAVLRTSRTASATVVPTYLGAHAKDPDRQRSVEETIELLDEVVQRVPGIACDAYCEKGAWSLEECGLLFDRAAALGCPIRVHADQFNPLGMTSDAVRRGARSVDHLEATVDAELEILARSATIGVALPGCGFHLDGRFAPARSLVDRGGALALATNCNPGSSPTLSLPFIIALAVRSMRLTPAEAITATTVNAAAVLGLDGDRGALESGLRADLQMLATSDERSLAYEYAHPGPDAVWIAGRRVV
jgi:imidazolonepropionase